MKVTTRKKEPCFIAFGELPAIGATFRFRDQYWMNIQSSVMNLSRPMVGPWEFPSGTINAVCLNNGKLAYIEDDDLIEVVEAELMVITND
jgi:hypothetical protein